MAFPLRVSTVDLRNAHTIAEGKVHWGFPWDAGDGRAVLGLVARRGGSWASGGLGQAATLAR
jgi:hypothetical protein